ncbi:cysteine desulfurase [Leptospira sp. GIMC2001]|uniref:cysteine desulfurase n=1 Tax=Leptospira sp. GIMC2001 TaxID=1513297 RepID=UPI002349CA7A|nr:cysteine desulfurase [Leptospira sp. GIMC2001]WCL51133.1 cysteine desulfurase [Leptospira sp. GIMC2001]
MLDAKRIKTDFPILQTTMNGKPLVYLDNAASSQKPFQVIDSVERYYREENANIHRGVYLLSQKATEKFEKTRIKISNFIKAQCAKAIIYTSGTTESINLVAQAWGRANVHEGDNVVLSHFEHHSNIVPWQMLTAEKKATLSYIGFDSDYMYDLSNLDSIITPKTKIVSISQMSNVTGSILNIKPIIEKARSVGALVFLDGAQGACHIPTNVKELDVDFYAFSAHKMLGPTGIGVLYGKEDILEAMPPWKGGGDMIENVELQYSTYAHLPAKLEAGTPNIAGVMGLASAIDYLNDIGLENIHEHEMSLMDYALEKIQEIPNITLYMPKDRKNRGGVLSFNMEGIHPTDIGTILDEEGIAVRTGHHCCQPFMKLNEIPGTCRASFYLYNTREDVDAFIQALKKVHKLFSKFVKA